MEVIKTDYREVERARLQRKAVNDLWWLMTEIGGIKVVDDLRTRADSEFCLSRTFHKPMLDAWDDNRRARRTGGGKHQLDLWSRDFGKSTCMRWKAIQDFLEDPTTTMVWFHAVEDQASKMGAWIAKTLQHHKKLRKLFPQGALPSLSKTKFYVNQEFTLPANQDGRPSFKSFGWTSEATGTHARYGKLDDIVARSIIEDNQQQKQASWYTDTVCNVVETSGWYDAVGTRWAEDDQYSRWLKSKHWLSRVRGALELDGLPDNKGKPTYMDSDLLERKKDEMAQAGELNNWDPQMQNDPSPAGEKPWNSSCEHFVKVDETRGAGCVVVLSDPAPAKVGTAIPQPRKAIYDGQKDYWANAVVKLRRRGQRNELILLDGSVSRDWDDQEGFDEVCRLQRKWATSRAAVEKVGSVAALYERAHRDSARRSGVRYSPVELEGVYRGKNHLFGALCAKAKADEFLISRETCDKEFLEMFLDQARNWRPMPNGSNGLRFDDCGNVVSFGCDPGVARLAPVVEEAPEFNPYSMPEREPAMNGSAYVRW